MSHIRVGFKAKRGPCSVLRVLDGTKHSDMVEVCVMELKLGRHLAAILPILLRQRDLIR